MFSHPVAELGKIFIVVGIVLVGVAFANPGYTDLLIILAAAMESLGFLMLVLGVIAQGFLRIERYLAGIPEMKAAFEASDPKAERK